MTLVQREISTSRPSCLILLFISFFFRIVNSFLLCNSFTPDEHWQSSEVAHYLTFGYGYLTWEWEPCVALRNILHPGIVAIFYKILQCLNLDFPWLVAYGPRIVIGTATSVAIDLGVYQLTALWTGPLLGIIAFICSLGSWFFFYTLCRTYSSCIEAVFMIWSVYWWSKSKFKLSSERTVQSVYVSRRMDRLLPSLALATVGIAFRPTSAIFWLFLFYGSLAVDFIIQPGSATLLKFSRLVLSYVIFFLSLALGPFLNLFFDFLFYKRWTIPAFNFAKFNFLADPGFFYGIRVWHFYLIECPCVTFFTYLPLLIIGAKYVFNDAGDAIFHSAGFADLKFEDSDEDTLPFSHLLKPRPKKEQKTMNTVPEDEVTKEVEMTKEEKENKSLESSEKNLKNVSLKQSKERGELLEKPANKSEKNEGLRYRHKTDIKQGYEEAQQSRETCLEKTETEEQPPRRNVTSIIMSIDPFLVIVAVCINLYFLSQASHKEYRLLIPFVPLLLPIISIGIYKIFAKSQRKVWNYPNFQSFSAWRYILLIFVSQAILALAVCTLYLRGADSTMSALRKEISLSRPTLQTPTKIFFLTPCHELPFYSFLHNPNVKLGFLDCSPQVRHLKYRARPLEDDSNRLIPRQQALMKEKFRKEHNDTGIPVNVNNPNATAPWHQRFWKQPVETLDMIFGPTEGDSTDFIEPFVDPTIVATWFTRKATTFGMDHSPVIHEPDFRITDLTKTFLLTPSLEPFAKCLDYRFDRPLHAQSLPDIFVVPSAALSKDGTVATWLKSKGYIEKQRIFNSIISEHPTGGLEMWSYIVIYKKK